MNERISKNIAEESSHQCLIEQANQKDISGILNIVRPLEKSGALVKRPRDRIESEIESFLVARWEKTITGCCAIFEHGEMAELACVAVHEPFRKNKKFPNIGTQLLLAGEKIARDKGIKTLFVLTTQARDWFLEKGFSDASLEDLPTQHKELYNWQRQSKILSKSLA